MMQRPIPSPQYWSAESVEWAAQQLGLSYPLSDDWPWIVAETQDLEKYFHLYSQIDEQATAPVRIVVMEMILEVASNGSLSTVEFQQVWPRIKALLDQDADSLATTAMYWCCWNVTEQNLEEDAFYIAPYMRDWWIANYPVPTETEINGGYAPD